MASGFEDLLTYTLGIGFVILGLVIGIFNQAGIGPAETAPVFTYNETDVFTVVSPEDGEAASGDNGAVEMASFGFFSVVNGLKTMLLEFVPYCDKFNIPQFISMPFQALIWLVFGYEMLQIKKIVWG